jgi:2-polyprenyl-3-methyl-5-hydroxy-6-metoxy-1,4-benzoquinol methylase/tetratricopeptide (TPR) repeat protein
VKPEQIVHAFDTALHHHRAGRLDAAAAGYRDVLQHTPEHADALHLLGIIDAQRGRLPQGVQRLQEAARLSPRNPEIRLNLGNALLAYGQGNSALDAYRAALALKPDFADAKTALLRAIERIGKFLQSENRGGEAIPLWREAIALAPDAGCHWRRLAAALETAVFVERDPALHDVLLRLLARTDVNPNAFYYAVLSYLRATPGFTDAIAKDEPPADLPGVDLLAQLLHVAIVADPEIERALTRWRAALLRRVDGGQRAAVPLSFVCALAMQCFATEYVYLESVDETAAIERLIARAKYDAEQLALIAAYRPLHEIAGAPTRAAAPLDVVVQRQVAEPRQELRLRDTIPALTPISDAVSRAVRGQYEENPYPRWFSFARPHEATNVSTRLGIADREILIAGCGTGSHSAHTAMRFPNARILAVDLSLTSLACAKRHGLELGLGRIEYAQADILELGRLQRRFDIVESIGVLHHLRDPLAGWRVLADLLKPGGIMFVGLYSELARRAVVDARGFIAAHGFTADADGIRAARPAILAAMDDSVTRRLRTNIDFYCLSGCRDLLFHVQEHRFTLPQIAAAIDALGLSFVRFDSLNPGVVAKYRARFPADPEMRSLADWDTFERDNPDTFPNMYQFWLRKPAAVEPQRGSR